MARQKQPATFCPTFDGAAIPTELSGGTPTGSATVTQAAGQIDLALDATSEAQTATLSMGDLAPFDIDDIQSFECIVELDAIPAANVDVAFGLMDAQNDTLDSIANGVYFRLDAAAWDVKVESDDGTNDNDDVDTGIDMTAATKYKFRINLRDGNTANVGSDSTGGKTNIKFAGDNAQGNLRPIDLNGTVINMTNYSAGLEPFFQISKASGTVTGTLSVSYLRIDYLKES